jgi:hypothetical protein
VLLGEAGDREQVGAGLVEHRGRVGDFSSSCSWQGSPRSVRWIERAADDVKALGKAPYKLQSPGNPKAHRMARMNA